MLLNDFSDEQVFCSFIAEEHERNRAIANIIGIKVATDFFKECGLPCSSKTALHKVKAIFRDADIADIYIGNLRLDVRLSLSSDEFCIPKKHFDLGIIPDLYMFVSYDKTTLRASVCGFVAPKEIDKSNSDDYYYYVSKTQIAPFEEVSEIFDGTSSAEVVLPPNIKKKILLYIDNQLPDKAGFYKELASSREARALLIEALYAQEALANSNFTFETIEPTTPVIAEVLPKEELCDLGFADGLSTSQKVEEPVVESVTSDLEEFIEHSNDVVSSEENTIEVDSVNVTVDETVEAEVEENAFDLDSLTDSVVSEPSIIDEEPETSADTVEVEPVVQADIVEQEIIEPEKVISLDDVVEEQVIDSKQEVVSEPEAEPVLELIELPEEVSDNEEIKAPVMEESVLELAEVVEASEEESSKLEDVIIDESEDIAQQLEDEVVAEAEGIEEDLKPSVESEELLDITPIAVSDFSEIPAELPLEDVSESDALLTDEDVDFSEDGDVEDNLDIEDSSVELETLDTEQLIENIEEDIDSVESEVELEDVATDAEEQDVIEEQMLEDDLVEPLEQDTFVDEVDELDLEPAIEDVSDISIEESDSEVVLDFEALPDITLEDDESLQLESGTEDIFTIVEEEPEELSLDEESDVVALDDFEPVQMEDTKVSAELDVITEDFVTEEIDEPVADDEGLSFNEFAEDVKNIEENSPQPQNSSQDEEDDYNERFDKYDNLDESYVPDFIPEELTFEGEAKTTKHEDHDEANNTVPLDIQATMEGFVNTLAPDEALNIAKEEEEVSDVELVDSADDDSLFEEIVQNDESVSDVEVEYSQKEEEPVVQKETIQALDSLYEEPSVTSNIKEGAEEETEEVFDNIEEVELDSEGVSVPHKKQKQSNPAGLVAGFLIIFLAVIGTVAYLNKDAMFEEIGKFFPTEEPIPNELAVQNETKSTQKIKEHKAKVAPKKTEVQELLNDVEEPVQLIDTSVSVAQLSIDCDVPSSLVTTSSRRYLVKLAKRVQVKLRNALLLANGQPLANRLVIDLSVVNDVIKFEKISSSSGSKKVDNIAKVTAEEVLKETQPYSGTFGQNSGNIRLIVKF